MVLCLANTRCQSLLLLTWRSRTEENSKQANEYYQHHFNLSTSFLIYCVINWFIANCDGPKNKINNNPSVWKNYKQNWTKEWAKCTNTHIQLYIYSPVTGSTSNVELSLHQPEQDKKACVESTQQPPQSKQWILKDCSKIKCPIVYRNDNNSTFVHMSGSLKNLTEKNSSYCNSLC